MKGAEAVLKRVSVCGIPAVEKLRVEKKYRAQLLDEKIRRERTRREARLLARAKLAGVFCPTVLGIDEFAIRMKFLKGKMLYAIMREGKEPSSRNVKDAAKILAALHSRDIVHGDFTPANLMVTKEGMAVIDFGLGFVSDDCEDKGMDILTMKKAIGKSGAAFVKAYEAAGGKAAAVRMAGEIERRGRYMERG
ncbi:MAG: KEOPS complex kinase/ATPase Bud32 [Candidatus Micrarchaeota archaeon]|nr:KEOPS complex kinase/ATPase Bud32 [Candidatus Micrarchaeota archaeon]